MPKFYGYRHLDAGDTVIELVGRRRNPLILAAAVAISIAVVSCGGGETRAHTGRVERELKTYLQDRTGERVKSTNCPEHVEIRVGSTYDCKATTTTGQILLVTMEQVSEPHGHWANDRIVKVTRSTKREREVNAKYAQIEIGQSEDEVREVFGKPDITETHKITGVGQANCWYYGGLSLAVPTIRICFKHDTVADKARYGNR